MSSSKTFDLILEHDHGKVQAAKLPRIHSVRKWVNKIRMGNVCIVGREYKGQFRIGWRGKINLPYTIGEVEICKSASLQVCKSASLQAKAATVKGIYRTKK